MLTKLYKVFSLVLAVFLYAEAESITELLDEAQNSLKNAFESRASVNSPFYYYKGETYYHIAVEETSKLNLEVGKLSAKKSIKWSLNSVKNLQPPKKPLIQGKGQLYEQLKKLYKLGGAVCSPEYTAKAEAYIDSLSWEGVSQVDKLIFKNRAEVYLNLALKSCQKERED